MIKEETAPVQGQATTTAQPIEATEQQESTTTQGEKTIPKQKKPKNASPEEDTITHRNVQEQSEEANPQAEANESKEAASENKGPKMKKKKVQ